MSLNINFRKLRAGAFLAIHSGMDYQSAVLALALTRAIKGNDPVALRSTAKRLAAGVAALEVRPRMSKIFRIADDAVFLSVVDAMIEATRRVLNEAAEKGYF